MCNKTTFFFKLRVINLRKKIMGNRTRHLLIINCFYVKWQRCIYQLSCEEWYKNETNFLLNDYCIHVEVTTFVISVTLFCLHKQRYTLRTLFHRWSRYDKNNINLIKTYMLIFLDYFLQKTYLLLQGHYSLTSIIRLTKLHA